MSQTVGHQTDHRDVDQGIGGLGQEFLALFSRRLQISEAKGRLMIRPLGMT